MTDLSSRIARYSYKPGWAFLIGEQDGKPALVALARVPDARGEKESFLLRGAKKLPAGVEDYTDDQLSSFVDALLKRMDDHERAEWLRRDGVLVNDPHGGSA